MCFITYHHLPFFMIPQVSIIIINYKTPRLTTECIDSILKYTQWVDFEIILVDNGSWIQSREYFEKYLPDDQRIKMIYSPNNLWFGWGNNLWYANSVGQYIFFLNSDTLLYEDSVSILYQQYKKISSGTMKIWLVGCRLYNDMKKTCIQIAGTRYVTVRRAIVASFPYLKNIFTDTYSTFVSNIDRNKSQVLSAVCGAAFFVEKQIWDHLGRFDEHFFLYMEEFDLAMRCQRLWYQNYYTTETSIIHLENQSPKITWKKMLFSLKSLLKFIYKFC